MTFTTVPFSGITVANGDQAYDIPAALLPLAKTATLPAQFATATTRDAALAALLAYSDIDDADVIGIRAYVVDRAAECVYQGATRGWEWQPQMRLLADAFEPSETGLGTTDPINLLLTGPYTLPGTAGNRRLMVVASAYCTTGAAAAFPRLQPWDIGISEPSARVQKYCPPSSAITLERTWYCTMASGTTIFPKLRGLSATATPVSMWNKAMQVFDLGPA